MLNSEASLKYAKEVTITAIENSIIQVGSSPAETAKNVAEFYRTLVLELRKKESTD